MKPKFAFFGAISSVLLLVGSANAAPTHPYLIVTESMYTELQARAANSPWKEMKAAALAEAANISYKSPADIYSKAGAMYTAVNAGALAYILDPANRATYVQKLIPVLKNWSDIYAEEQATFAGADNKWSWFVPVAGAFFNSILCMDIIYNDVPVADRIAIETEFQKMATWFTYTAGDMWPPCGHGALGVHAMYKGDSTQTRFQMVNYKMDLFNYFSSDGVFKDGAEYADGRMNGIWQRDAKAHFLDVLQFTGKDTTYYNDTRLQKLYEWLYGYAATPANMFVSFGDTPPFDRPYAATASIAGSYRFSGTVAGYAAYRNHGAAFTEARLLTYLFLDRPLPAPIKPVSRIWQGLASFWEANPDSLSLMAALWCPTAVRVDAHCHKEVNAIQLTAYGEQVLVNSGYVGWNLGVLGYSWDDIHNSALYCNTVMIKVPDHKWKAGGGITEGFTNASMDYANSYSDTAMADGKHWRSLCFVRPQDNVPGYFPVFDEVTATSVTDKIYVGMHPNADNITAVSALKEYRSKIGPQVFSGHDVYLSVFQGTVPDSATVRDGVIANGWSGGSIASKFLYSVYHPDVTLRKNIVTVLFPFDASHSKATMQRLTGSNYTGASIDLGSGVIDLALESQGTDTAACQNAKFIGQALLQREKTGSMQFYFVRKGTYFKNAASPGRGFSSTNAVSVFVKDSTGSIVSPGAGVTFYYPGVASVFLNNAQAALVASGKDWVTVDVSAGTYALRLSSQPSGIRASAYPVSVSQNLVVKAAALKGNAICVNVTLRTAGTFTLSLYDITGRPVRAQTMVSGNIGSQKLFWNLGSIKGGVANAVYFVVLTQGKEMSVAKVSAVW